MPCYRGGIQDSTRSLTHSCVTNLLHMQFVIVVNTKDVPIYTIKHNMFIVDVTTKNVNKSSFWLLRVTNDIDHIYV